MNEGPRRHSVAGALAVTDAVVQCLFLFRLLPRLRFERQSR